MKHYVKVPENHIVIDFDIKDKDGNKSGSGVHLHLYSYDGPVMEFDRCIDNRWVSSTYAESEKKARNNLAYQFKKLTGRVARTAITLPGKIIEVEEE